MRIPAALVAMLSIAALITNYNTWPDAARCAHEIARHCEDRIARILIVDDASEQAPPDDLSPQVEVVRNDENRGFAAM